jgi:hypothetical protein
MSRIYNSSPPTRLRACSGTALACLLPNNVKIKTSKTIILHFVLYWCVNLDLLAKRKNINREGAGKIFGSKREEVTKGWKKVHYEEIRSFVSVIREISSGG